jgi:hypothetical protein
MTVDLDYWTYDRSSWSKHISYNDSQIDKATNFVRHAMSNAGSIYLIKYHDGILKCPIPSDVDTLINVDFHNDIIAEKLSDPADLNEGTWGNFLPQKITDFKWRYPNHRDCVQRGWGVCRDSASDRIPDAHEYHLKYKADQGIESEIPFNDISQLVICYSPNWDSLHILDDITKALRLPLKLKSKTPVKFSG